MLLKLGIPEFEDILDNVIKNLGIDPKQASD